MAIPEYIYAVILAICGLISAIGGACVYIGKVIKKAKEPEIEQNRRLTEVEKRCDKYDRILEKDKRDIEEIKKVEHLILKTEFALLQHGIDGNNVEPMKRAQEDIQNYLIDK